MSEYTSVCIRDLLDIQFIMYKRHQRDTQNNSKSNLKDIFKMSRILCQTTKTQETQDKLINKDADNKIVLTK